MARKSRKAVNQVILPAAPSEKIYRAGLYARISVETERKEKARGRYDWQSNSTVEGLFQRKFRY